MNVLDASRVEIVISVIDVFWQKFVVRCDRPVSGRLAEPLPNLLHLVEELLSIFVTHFSFDDLNLFVTGHGLLSTLSRNQIAVANLKTCIDFGCGVGRLSVALAAQFDQVTAVDVSASHLAIANQVFTKRHISNVATLHLAQITDVHTLPCVDLIYSVIVLQHNPPPVIRYLLCALFGRLNPGGVAVIQLPTYLPKGYRFVANEYLVNGGTGMEMHALPQRVIFRDARTSGIDVLEVLEDSWTGYGVGSCSNTFVFQRPAA